MAPLCCLVGCCAWKTGQRIPSLQEFLLVSQDAARVACYHRRSEREWLLTEVEGLDETIELASAGCRLALSDVYERVR